MTVFASYVRMRFHLESSFFLCCTLCYSHDVVGNRRLVISYIFVLIETWTRFRTLRRRKFPNSLILPWEFKTQEIAYLALYLPLDSNFFPFFLKKFFFDFYILICLIIQNKEEVDAFIQIACSILHFGLKHEYPINLVLQFIKLNVYLFIQLVDPNNPIFRVKFFIKSYLSFNLLLGCVHQVKINGFIIWKS